MAVLELNRGLEEPNPEVRALSGESLRRYLESHRRASFGPEKVSGLQMEDAIIEWAVENSNTLPLQVLVLGPGRGAAARTAIAAGGQFPRQDEVDYAYRPNQQDTADNSSSGRVHAVNVDYQLPVLKNLLRVRMGREGWDKDASMVHADGMKLPFRPHRSFAYADVSSVIHEVPDVYHVMDEVASTLQNGGIASVREFLPPPEGIVELSLDTPHFRRFFAHFMTRFSLNPGEQLYQGSADSLHTVHGDTLTQAQAMWAQWKNSDHVQVDGDSKIIMTRRLAWEVIQHFRMFDRDYQTDGEKAYDTFADWPEPSEHYMTIAPTRAEDPAVSIGEQMVARFSDPHNWNVHGIEVDDDQDDEALRKHFSLRSLTEDGFVPEHYKTQRMYIFIQRDVQEEPRVLPPFKWHTREALQALYDQSYRYITTGVHPPEVREDLIQRLADCEDVIVSLEKVVIGTESHYIQRLAHTTYLYLNHIASTPLPESDELDRRINAIRTNDDVSSFVLGLWREKLPGFFDIPEEQDTPENLQELVRASLDEIQRIAGQPIPREYQIENLVRSAISSADIDVIAQAVFPRDPQLFFHIYNAMDNPVERIGAMKVYDNVVTALAQLRASGKRLHVVTHYPQLLLDVFSSHLELYGIRFRTAVSAQSRDWQITSPHPGLLYDIMNEFNATRDLNEPPMIRNRTAYVGRSPHGVAAGKMFGTDVQVMVMHDTSSEMDFPVGGSCLVITGEEVKEVFPKGPYPFS